MNRSKEMVLISIGSLLNEVKGLASRMSVQINGVSFTRADTSNLVPNRQIAQITDSLIRLSTTVGASANQRNELVSLVARVFDTSIKAWLESNLDSIIAEAKKDQGFKQPSMSKR